LNLFTSFWVLPILFILHDFEEMIIMPLWKEKHFDLLSHMHHPYFGSVTNGQAFSIGVLEELLILIAISIICGINNNHALYTSCLITFAIHFLKHFTMCISAKSYVPGIISSIMETPFVVWLIIHRLMLNQIPILNIFYNLIPVFIFMYINLKIMHKIMPKIQNRLLSYARP